MDRGWTFDQIARLTDRQIAEVLFHKRDKQGNIAFPDIVPVTPDKPLTLEEEEGKIDQLAAFLSLLPGPGTQGERREAMAAKLRADLKAKREKDASTDGQPT